MKADIASCTPNVSDQMMSASTSESDEEYLVCDEESFEHSYASDSPRHASSTDGSPHRYT
jgi:hypothetical protein